MRAIYANRTPEGQYLMNGLYLPALIQVLNSADLEMSMRMAGSPLVRCSRTGAWKRSVANP